MSASEVLLLAFLIGVVAGLRALTAPAVLAWAAHKNWLNLHNTPLSFMASTAAVVIFFLLAAGELVADQLPSTPSRTKPPGTDCANPRRGTIWRGRRRCGRQSLALGAVLGIAGSLVGTYGGHAARIGLAKTLKAPDFLIAVLEDAVAIGGGLFIVSRF